MKRIIFLNVEDANPDNKKLKKAELKVLEEEKQQKAVNTFKAELKHATVIIKIIHVLPEAQVIIEYADAHVDLAYDFLRKLDVVQIIDSILPVGY